MGIEEITKEALQQQGAQFFPLGVHTDYAVLRVGDSKQLYTQTTTGNYLLAAQGKDTPGQQQLFSTQQPILYRDAGDEHSHSRIGPTPPYGTGLHE